jgi:hypothetical protein
MIWLVLAYFFALSWITWKVTQSGLKRDNKTFLTRVYGGIGIRLLFSFFPVIIYMMFANEFSLVFITAYLLIYFFYTTFEIYMLVVNLRPDSDKKSGS